MDCSDGRRGYSTSLSTPGQEHSLAKMRTAATPPARVPAHLCAVPGPVRPAADLPPVDARPPGCPSTLATSGTVSAAVAAILPAARKLRPSQGSSRL